jgi:FAD synthetase
MKTVMAFGTFSMVHPGHLVYLEESKKLGDKLIVVITADSVVEKEKGARAIFDQNERKALVSSVKFVDEAVVGNNDDFFSIITEKRPDVIALGYDSHYDEKELEKKLAGMGLVVDVYRIKKYTHHKTREIVKKIKTGR